MKSMKLNDYKYVYIGQVLCRVRYWFTNICNIYTAKTVIQLGLAWQFHLDPEPPMSHSRILCRCISKYTWRSLWKSKPQRLWVHLTWPEGKGCEELHTRYRPRDFLRWSLSRCLVSSTLDNRRPKFIQSLLSAVSGNLLNILSTMHVLCVLILPQSPCIMWASVCWRVQKKGVI